MNSKLLLVSIITITLLIFSSFTIVSTNQTSLTNGNVAPSMVSGYPSNVGVIANNSVVYGTQSQIWGGVVDYLPVPNVIGQYYQINQARATFVTQTMSVGSGNYTPEKIAVWTGLLETPMSEWSLTTNTLVQNGVAFIPNSSYGILWFEMIQQSWDGSVVTNSGGNPAYNNTWILSAKEGDHLGISTFYNYTTDAIQFTWRDYTEDFVYQNGGYHDSGMSVVSVNESYTLQKSYEEACFIVETPTITNVQTGKSYVTSPLDFGQVYLTNVQTTINGNSNYDDLSYFYNLGDTQFFYIYQGVATNTDNGDFSYGNPMSFDVNWLSSESNSSGTSAFSQDYIIYSSD